MEMRHKQLPGYGASSDNDQHINSHFFCHTLATNSNIALRTMAQESTGIGL